MTETVYSADLETSWTSIKMRAVRLLPILQREAQELRALVEGGGWYHLDQAEVEHRLESEMLESGLVLMMEARALSAQPVSASQAAHRAEAVDLISALVEPAAHLEVGWAAIQAGLVFMSDLPGIVDNLLREYGVHTPNADRRAALFEVMRETVGRKIHEAWTTPEAEAPDRVRDRVRQELLRDAKKLVVEFGTSNQLGVRDRELPPEKKRAAHRLERGGNWDLDETVELREDEHDYQGALNGRDSDQLVEHLEFLEAFKVEEASPEELELLMAVEQYGTPSEALEAIGQPGNWSRLQSLQRRVKRFASRG